MLPSLKRFLLPLMVIACSAATVYSQNMGNGFYDHGVAVPISNHRGIVATVDGNGRNVVLLWLFDHRGGYALLMIDAETGKSEQFPMPFKPGDAPYASMLSSKNRFYTLFNNHFAEFDPVKRAFTFSSEAHPQNTMGLTEDDNGVIWAVTFPNSGLVSYDPATRSFKDHGYLYKQNWKQYPRYLAADDKGWLYFAIGNTASQIVAFDPSTGKAAPLLEESERKRGPAYVYRSTNGKVYGNALRGNKDGWYEFYQGKKLLIGQKSETDQKPVINGSQVLFYDSFPDGKKLKSVDLLEKKMVVTDPVTKTAKTIPFEYSSEGALVMGVGAAPDGTIAGGSAFPMRFFNYDPKKGTLQNKPAYGQFNAMASRDGLFYFGSYPQGALLEWDPTLPWGQSAQRSTANPVLLGNSLLMTHRPHCVLPYDGRTVILSGTPEYGYTGGGLVIYDKQQKTMLVLKDSAIVTDQSTMSMITLPHGKMLGGTTTMPGSGGEKKAKEAELYIMDMATHTIEWHAPIIPGVQDYLQFHMGPKGLIYGIADRRKFFVFDAVKKKLVYVDDVESKFGVTTYAQGPRIFVEGPKKTLYMIFKKGIVSVRHGNYKMNMIAESPRPIETGGAYLDGKIYFVIDSHLFSYQLPK